MEKKVNTFNVLWHNFNKRKPEPYDILPYFREEWNGKYHKEEKNKIKETKSKELLKQWITNRSSYRFWGRCEYEHLVASWPFGSYKIKEDLKKLFIAEFDIEKLDDRIKFYNILMQDMEKIDIHDQIMMNIDIITDILYNEFKLNENI
jgi:ribonucleotide reductase alpha subunit